jgi:glycosyltransferase involved in cell wall biosynthesis
MKNVISIHVLSFCIVTNILGYSFDRVTIINSPWSRGPGCVVRSFIEGLQKLDIPFTHNPSQMKELSDVVVILSDPENVKVAIEWKKAGRIKYIFAGPNLVTRSYECNYLLASPEIDVILVPCDWARINFIQDDARLIDKIKIWYAGVDETYWKPITNHTSDKSNNVLIYDKYADRRFCDRVQKLLVKYGWNPVVLQYGSYSHQQYKELLATSAFAVFLSVSESQGIALAESWAMDVPTVVWNPQDLVAYGKRFDPISSCPYLTQDTGLDFKTVADLEIHLKTIEQQLPSFKPRQWIVEHMTDVKSAQLLLDIIEETIGSKKQELS